MNSFSSSLPLWIIITLLATAGVLSYLSRKLTLAGSVTGVLLAFLIYAGAGLPGIVMLAAFFVLGTAVTSYRKDQKLHIGLVQPHEARRTANQVVANAGVAGILSILPIALNEHSPVWMIMLASSFASATGDTFSSELGNVYGRNFYNILTLKKDKRGLNGVISFEGIVFGLCGSIAIGVIHILFFGWSSDFVIIVAAGLAGNLFDSLLGALLERRGLLGNDAVNFLNTAFAAIIAFLLMMV